MRNNFENNVLFEVTKNLRNNLENNVLFEVTKNLRNNLENKDNVLYEVTKIINEISLKNIDPKINQCIHNTQRRTTCHLNKPGTSSLTPMMA
ncbi:hypothetical protein C2G38_2254573 [Gigaspora rosea]|uniref:Uncharacterized protein n=1 Tax=Gigaspora rosea TaxID=44941 RepID=A0A397U4Z0_9GLOM|nr:hypothetical protein C2G38_2254573 [Gigaspora rosea]